MTTIFPYLKAGKEIRLNEGSDETPVRSAVTGEEVQIGPKEAIDVHLTGPKEEIDVVPIGLSEEIAVAMTSRNVDNDVALTGQNAVNGFLILTTSTKRVYY